MSTLLSNDFSQYELSPLELRAATTFNELQRQFIQNEISVAAHEKIALTFDPQNPLRFAQQEAELTGKIEILKYLLVAQSLYNPTQPQDSE